MYETYDTFKEYIEACLFRYPTLFRNRFDVLCHAFAADGNGLDFYKGKLIKEEFHPDDYIDEVAEAKKMHSREAVGMPDELITLLKNDGNLLWKTFELMKQTQEIEYINRALCWRDNYYHVPQLNELHLYDWCSIERYQPFRDFANCVYEDVIDQLEYFRDILLQGEDKQNYEGSYEEYHTKALADWKENIQVLNTFIEKLKENK